jgi:hypothetical protein
MTPTQTIVVGVAGTAIISFIGLNSIRRYSKRIPIKVVDHLPHGYNAMTIPPWGIYIVKSQANNKELIKHELIHWMQYQKLGLFGYYSRYFSELKCYGYDGMPMEIEARACECDACKTDYTQCVRGGQARTVYNPSFRMDL